ncbi:MAG: endonuclease domain-containing protein [Nitrospirota bacterium]
MVKPIFSILGRILGTARKVNEIEEIIRILLRIGKGRSKVAENNPHPLPPLPEAGEGVEDNELNPLPLFPSPITGRGAGVRVKREMTEKKNILSQAAKELRHNLTEEEKILWERLRNRQLNGYKFRRQESVGRFVADFICYERKILIEVDGSQHMEQKVRDKERGLWFKNQGYEILRFWNYEVREDIEIVLGKIRQSL